LQDSDQVGASSFCFLSSLLVPGHLLPRHIQVFLQLLHRLSVLALSCFQGLAKLSHLSFRLFNDGG
jgi:hypothetical protein